LHGGDQFMVVYATIVGPGDRPQFDATIVGFERLDLFCAMIGKAVLEVDAGKLRR